MPLKRTMDRLRAAMRGFFEGFGNALARTNGQQSRPARSTQSNMSYRNRRAYSDDYSWQLRGIKEVSYDGLTAIEMGFDGQKQSEQYRRRYAVKDWDRFILPQQLTWLNLEDLFSPLSIPVLPAIPPPPDRENTIWSELKTRITQKKAEFDQTFSATTVRLTALRSKFEVEEPGAIAEFVEIANLRHPIDPEAQKAFRAFAEPTAKVLLVEIQFPDFAGHEFQIGRKNNGDGKYASAAQKKKIVRQSLCSLVIRAGYLASKVLEKTSYKTIAINVSQDWFDPATGAPRTGIICSLQAQVSEFTALQLDRVDPEACFRHLKGIAVPSFDSISPVRPIFVMNKNDDRFIATKDLDSVLAPEANLAAMPWEDFEQLVAQLFEWEFVKEGVEVRVTRVSRDRGVDAVLFDPDPLRGGKYVLQAKRYTKPVDVAAVRDLFGTVVNEGANRGILITTSSYGPDSYAFAKDKPISLVDGPNLLVMLRRHGKKFRIDLEEARRLNHESGDNA